MPDFITAPTGYPPRPFNSSWFTALLFAMVFAGLFINLGGVPLFDEDEGNYAEVTREMLASGDFVTPRVSGKPFFHKPPMIYWTQAASAAVFGLSEFALRLPSALASLLWAVTLFLFARRYLGRQIAGYAVFFMVTSIQTGIIAKAAIADALLNLFITLTMFGIFKYYLQPTLRYLCLTYAFMALGFLTKGPVAVLIPLLASGLFFGFKGKLKTLLPALFNPVGWAVFLIIALPWYIALYVEHGRAFVDEIFLVHNIARFQSAFEGHSGPLFYYLPVILLGMLPHTAFIIKALADVRTLLKDDVNLFLLVWFGIVLVFFSLAATKLHHYIVYGYVPLFIFMARKAEALRRALFQSIWPLAFLTVLFFLPEIAGMVQPYIGDEFARLVLAGALPQLGIKHRLIVGTVLAAVAVMPLVRHFPKSYATILTGILFMGLVNFYAMPLAGSIMQQPVKEAALLAKKNDYHVVMWAASYPSFAVYREEIIVERPLREGDIVLTKANKLNKIKQYRIIYQKNGIVMARVMVP